MLGRAISSKPDHKSLFMEPYPTKKVASATWMPLRSAHKAQFIVSLTDAVVLGLRNCPCDAFPTFLSYRPRSRNIRFASLCLRRVSIVVSACTKHELPVDEECAWSHLNRISKEAPPCVFKNGSLPESYGDLMRCMDDARCNINDSDLQMAIFRDPRAVTVSSYYWLVAHYQKYRDMKKTVDQYVLRMFLIICQWIVIRFYLFEGILSSRSVSFWYNEDIKEPLEWHKRFLYLVGLQLPEAVVQAACNATTGGNTCFRTIGLDKHPGGEAASSNRSYVDEVRQETLAFMDETLRRWMPPMFRSKLQAISEL